MYHFYAFLDRMKYIRRWSLMRSSREENVMEHSWQVAVLAHALALIDTEICGNAPDISKTVLYALYHECSEVMTGDLPTPIKYFNPEMRGAYRRIEERANDRLLSMLPDQVRGGLSPFVLADAESYEYKLVKAADKLSAYIKCLEELKAGNSEFESAAKQTMEAMVAMELPCLDWFLTHCLESFRLNLDQLE